MEAIVLVTDLLSSFYLIQYSSDKFNSLYFKGVPD